MPHRAAIYIHRLLFEPMHCFADVFFAARRRIAMSIAR